MSLAPGVRLGPYEVIAPIGAGGMGEVYRARDTRLERDVALKVLPDEVSRDAEAVLPAGLERIVRHCLEKQPAERFQSARDLAFDLEAAFGSSASEPAGPAAAAMKRPPGSRTAGPDPAHTSEGPWSSWTR